MVKKKRQANAHLDGSSTDSAEEKADCQHIKKGTDASKLRKLLKSTGLSQECMQCAKDNANSLAKETNEVLDTNESAFEYDNTLWLCLKCGTQLCGRSKNGHALHHFKTPHSDCHALTMNTSTFEIWCYECDNEVNSRKSLRECLEAVERAAKKPPRPEINNIEGKILATYEAIRPLVPAADDMGTNNKAIPLPPPPPLPPIPGIAKRVNDSAVTCSVIGAKNTFPTYTAMSKVNTGGDRSDQLLKHLPRVRGLTNLGNTCFFNAVMQCLAQTPYLLEVLKESSEPGEEFILPGGNFKLKDEQNVQLPMIKGTLSSWGSLTSALAQALEELQSGGGVFTPSKLFEKLCKKCPQFRGGDQHDSHELLRHLLESVRSEDLKRYQRVILQNLGYTDQDINSLPEEFHQRCKIYGNQAADRILRPEQVFRGFLVSTLTCQDCYHVSSRHEYFLDMSLPVSVEKPQPPQRRKTSPENSHNPILNAVPTAATAKSQQKEQKEKKRLAKWALKAEQKQSKQTGSGSSSSEQSDADVEDNLIDDNSTNKKKARSPVSLCDSNGNNQILTSPSNPEKRGDSPENTNKDSLEDSGNGGGPYSGMNGDGGSGSDLNSVTTNNSVLAIGLSEKGANLMRQLSFGEPSQTPTKSLTTPLTNGELKDEAALAAQLDQLQLKQRKTARMKAKRVRTQSYSDWSTTIAPRYQCEDGECSVQSCLNNFTAVELMTGSNKVGCENCTKSINGDDPKAKTVYTNATKQFLISSPPAVLILHLKRFQLGPRCIFRKLTRAVSFPMVLDIAPFCGSKVKNLPNIDRKQKKLMYALYGIVEHSGGMYGGHYTAYVKVRPKILPDDKRWKFMPQGSKAELDQDDEQRKKLDELLAKEKARELRMKAADDSDDLSSNDSTSSSSSSDPEETTLLNPDADVGAVGGDLEAGNVQVPIGKWYYVSDSRVQEVTEEEVLKAQAYLLFYERIY